MLKGNYYRAVKMKLFVSRLSLQILLSPEEVRLREQLQPQIRLVPAGQMRPGGTEPLNDSAYEM